MRASVRDRLTAEVAELLNPLRVRVRPDAEGFTADLVRADGSVLWPNYAHGPDELLTVLAAEQRFLVEDRGQGSVVGATYFDKARVRLRRASEGEA